jgi:hypothetical protein
VKSREPSRCNSKRSLRAAGRTQQHTGEDATVTVRYRSVDDGNVQTIERFDGGTKQAAIVTGRNRVGAGRYRRLSMGYLSVTTGSLPTIFSSSVLSGREGPENARPRIEAIDHEIEATFEGAASG